MADNPSPRPPHSAPSDFRLLLRAHAEARWLSHEVVPVLRELEQEDALGDEQLGAALAYLEVLWIEACGRAAETEATCTELNPLTAGSPLTADDLGPAADLRPAPNGGPAGNGGPAANGHPAGNGGLAGHARPASNGRLAASGLRTGGGLEAAYGDHSLHGRAQRYHAAVRGLRDTVARRVAELLAAPNDSAARWPITDRRAST